MQRCARCGAGDQKITIAFLDQAVIEKTFAYLEAKAVAALAARPPPYRAPREDARVLLPKCRCERPSTGGTVTGQLHRGQSAYSALCRACHRAGCARPDQDQEEVLCPAYTCS